MALTRRKFDPSLSQRTGDAEALRQQVVRELRKLHQLVLTMGDEIVALVESSSSGAPAAAPYVVTALDGTLTAERVLTAGTGINVADGGANGPVTVSCTVTQLTQEQVEDYVGAMVLGGTGISAVYNDGLGTLTISGSVTQYTDEMARDAVGAALVAGTGMTITVNDGADTITIATTITQYTDEMARDAIGTALVAGAGIGVTVNDGADTITVAVVATPPVVDPAFTLYEVNFSTLANNTLTNGTESIDGHNWTAANMGSLGTAAVTNGSGIILSAGTSLGTAATYTTATRNAPHIAIPWSSIPNWDGRGTYLIELYIPSRTLEQNGDVVFAGAHGAASDPASSSVERVRYAGFLNNAGTQNLRMMVAATPTQSPVNVATHNVLALRISADGTAQFFSGTWSSGWPAILQPLLYTSNDTSTISPFFGGNAELVIGLGVVNDASPTTTVTIERMRVRRAV